MRCRVVALRSSLRSVFVFGLCLALLPRADVPLLVRGRTQMPNQPLGHPRRGKPAGALPDLEDIQRESQIEREAPPPSPSTVRSPKLPLKPWDGRRVGDPFEQPPGQHSIAEKVGRPSRLGARMRRAHASARFSPPPVLDDQFVQNFFSLGLARNPASDETTYWNDQLRVAYGQGQASVKLAALDSSYLRLTDNSGSLAVYATDGTKLSFTWANGKYYCSEIKDRNGNYLTIAYNTFGRLTNITDTLGRVVTFNYDSNLNLLSITQAWNGQPAHQWVSFGWASRTMQSSFTNGRVTGTANGTTVPVITQVALNDTSYFTLDYTNSLQVSVIRNYDVQSMFESVASGGGFFSAPGSSYNTVGGDITDNKGAIYFSNDPRFYSYGPVNRTAELAFLSGTFYGMAQTTIHELLHHAGFGDRALANTAAFFRKEKVTFDNSWEGTLAASKYWDKTLQEHCH